MEQDEQISPADLAGVKLYEQALSQLGSGTWQPDVAELEAALQAAPSKGVKARLANLITHHHFTAGALEPALAACRQWLEFAPDEDAARNSLNSVLLRLNRIDELIEAASAQLETDPDNFRLRSSLANANARLGRWDEARVHGNAGLQLQDAMTAVPDPGPLKIKVPGFDPAARERNVIAFSLYGDKRKYVGGAIENLRAARVIYPEWTCCFYIDESVPAAAVEVLTREGARIRHVKGLPAARYGTFWRFLVADEANLDRFLVRDCDSLLNLRERAAVMEWVQGDRHFHLMRDDFAHTDLVLAGMWGGVGGALPQMLSAVVDFCKTAPFARTADQRFLRERIWPWMRHSVLSHDSCYSFGDSRDFPAEAAIPGLKVGHSPRG